MKNSIFFTIFFTIFLFQSSFSQSHFKPSNGAIIWQKVYEAANRVNPSVIALQLDGMEQTDSLITGRIKNSTVNYTEYGARRMQMPLYMVEPFNASVIIEIKPGRYRVTINSIEFVDIHNREFTNIAEYCLTRKNEIRNSQIKALDLFNLDLTERFTVNSKEW